MAVVAIKWTSVTFYDMYLLREIILPILEMTYLRYFDIYDVIGVIFDENTQILNSASSPMAVVAIKWTSVTFYDMYLLREIILPTLEMTYLRYFDIYDVISVIFNENFQILNSASSTMAVVAIKWTSVTLYNMYLL